MAPRWIVLLVAALPAVPCQAQDALPRTQFDHTTYLVINSEPPAVDVYAVSADGTRAAQRIGRTPFTLLVGLTWEKPEGRRGPRTLKARSPGDVCRVVPRSDHAHELFLSCIAAKRGFKAKKIDSIIATLGRPGFARGPAETWPVEVPLTIRLDPKPAVPGKEQQARPGGRLPRVVTGAGAVQAPAAMGSVEITSNVIGAYVLVDGRRVATTPVELVLTEGRHAIQVVRNGYIPFAQEVSVEAGFATPLHADLGPAGP